MAENIVKGFVTPVTEKYNEIDSRPLLARMRPPRMLGGTDLRAVHLGRMLFVLACRIRGVADLDDERQRNVDLGVTPPVDGS